MSSWTKEKTILLIELTRKSNIWDVKLKEYKDLNVRKDKISEIAEKLNFSVKEVEDKWHNIKSQFSRELSKINNSKKSGCGTDEVFTSSWYAFNNLTFLKDQYTPHKSRSTDENTDQITTQSVGNFTNEEEDLQTTATPAEIQKNQPQPDNHINLTTRVPVTGKKRKRCQIQDNGTEMDSVVQVMKTVGERLARRQDHDEFSVFGNHVANELRSLKEKTYRAILARAKHNINTALHEAEMAKIDLDNTVELISTSPFSPASTSSMVLVYSNPATPEVQHELQNEVPQ